MPRALLVLAICAAAATVAAAATTASSQAATCSAARLSKTVPKQNVPAVVARVRQQIVNAAVACDYAALERIGKEKGSFSFSFGSEHSAAAYWRRLEARHLRPLALLVAILKLPVTRNETRAYAWPSAYTAHPTRADWNALVRAGVLTRVEADAERRGGNVYYGYRTAISPAGDWQFFIKGD
jgi:hypothetical protein